MGKERAEKTKEFGGQCSDGTWSAKVEELTYSEKIVKALDFCEVYLEKSIAASKSASEESDSWVWNAAAELEYALFLFSLKRSDENVTLNGRSRSGDRSGSTAKLLNMAKNLVIRSKALIATRHWLQACRCTYAAGNLLRRIQREHEKMKQGSIRK